MERHVKERLIGAAVLVAAAVILIPEMLSGPTRPAAPSAPARAGEAPMKTYTIDLNHSPDAAATAPTSSPTVVEERAPPPEVVTNEPAKAAPAPEPAAPSAAINTPPAKESVASESPRTPPPPEAPRKPQTIPESAPVKAAPKPLAPATSAPTTAQAGRQWAVQLGSFSSKATADKLAKDWEAKGMQAFVMPVKSGNNTLYRVRIGPFPDRGDADDVLRKAASQVKGAAVVAHP